MGSDDRTVPVPEAVELVYGLYPGVEFFSDEYGAEDYREWVEQSNGDPVPAPLAVYIQDPSDDAPPLRGKDISSSRRPAAVHTELRLQGELFDKDRCVQQLICSGAVVSEWTDDQLYELIAVLQSSFTTQQNGLVNWCACLGRAMPSESRLRLLRVLGFAHVRLTLQDRAWPPSVAREDIETEDIETLVETARHVGMRQVSIDLNLGDRTDASFAAWLEKFMARVGPDRLRLMNVGRREAVSTARDTCLQVLAELGYRHIGLDWLVRTSDAWWQARLAGRLRWSLLGFTDMHRPDVIGIGVGAVSSTGDAYARNEAAWDAYQALLDRGVIPVVQGLELESDDVLRREIMVSMLTASRIEIAPIEDKWGIEFNQFFAEELRRLKAYERAGWVSLKPRLILVHARGRGELADLCRTFDRRSRMPQDRCTPSFA